MCKHKGCNSKVTSLGYCGKHYKQFKKHGKTFKVTHRDPNEVILYENYYELILLDKNMEEKGRAKIDKEDYCKVKNVRWCLDTEGYVVSSKGKMHRVLMNATEDDEVDHRRTGIKSRSDNRKNNLRLCTKTQNRFNQKMYKNNKSGYKGVSLDKKANKWRADIRIEGKLKCLGRFESPELAYGVYVKAAKELHKDFKHDSVR